MRSGVWISLTSTATLETAYSTKQTCIMSLISYRPSDKRSPGKDPRLQYAFENQVLGVSCISHRLTQLAAFFIDQRTEWSTVCSCTANFQSLSKIEIFKALIFFGQIVCTNCWAPIPATQALYSMRVIIIESGGNKRQSRREDKRPTTDRMKRNEWIHLRLRRLLLLIVTPLPDLEHSHYR